MLVYPPAHCLHVSLPFTPLLTSGQSLLNETKNESSIHFVSALFEGSFVAKFTKQAHGVPIGQEPSVFAGILMKGNQNHLPGG